MKKNVDDQYYMMCHPCYRAEVIAKERHAANQMQRKQANSMLSATAKKFKAAKDGDNVMIPIPDVDRGRAEFRNIAGVVTRIDDKGSYAIGTSPGTLKGMFMRAEFILTAGTF